ncbi:glutaredoxin-related protein 5 mitochondrial [Biomphalaria pfeifferi]|uniref:Glutaredoxin-related protein 5, mitochondrial n=1 Tax=Biomphalaria pfeifferi TaxID=112525 RepID=A0AAD8F6X2_BIOPF|nr:glutaredoxin-related protein 5 mitochondrial [Biomphalaria pfeifferi]
MNAITRSVLSHNFRSSFQYVVFRAFSNEAKNINFDDLVKGKPIVVFMKGTPVAPRCGFSNAVCEILKLHGVKDFTSYDVLSDDAVREGIKKYTNWPTIPQVFFDGEFVGGCDIMLDMHKNGDLIKELQKVGIRSALLDAKDNSDGKS